METWKKQRKEAMNYYEYGPDGTMSSDRYAKIDNLNLKPSDFEALAWD